MGFRQRMKEMPNGRPMVVEVWFYYHTQAISVKNSGGSAFLILAFYIWQIVIA
jgi:hypothetical protein